MGSGSKKYDDACCDYFYGSICLVGLCGTGPTRGEFCFDCSVASRLLDMGVGKGRANSKAGLSSVFSCVTAAGRASRSLAFRIPVTCHETFTFDLSVLIVK